MSKKKEAPLSSKGFFRSLSSNFDGTVHFFSRKMTFLRVALPLHQPLVFELSKACNICRISQADVICPS